MTFNVLTEINGKAPAMRTIKARGCICYDSPIVTIAPLRVKFCLFFSGPKPTSNKNRDVPFTAKFKKTADLGREAWEEQINVDCF